MAVPRAAKTVTGWLVIGIVIGLVGGFLVGKATGVNPRLPTCYGACHNTQALRVTKRDNRLAKNFRTHKHVAINPAHIFRSPTAARRVVVAMVVKAMKDNPYQAMLLRERINAEMMGVRKPAGGIRPMDGTYCQHDLCYAEKSYEQMLANGGCAGEQKLGMPDPMWCANASIFPHITKKEIQIGGALTICAGAVGLAVLSAPDTAGASSVVLTKLIPGWAGCGWAYWVSVDHW